MNKLKLVILVILRVVKLGLLSYLPVKKDIYISAWYCGLANNIIQLVQAEYLSKRFCFTLHVPPHNFLKVEEKYPLHDIKQMQRSSFPTVFGDLLEQPNTSVGSTFGLFRRMFYRFDSLPFSPDLADYRQVLRQELFPIIPRRADDLIKDDTLVIHMRSGDVFGEDLTKLHEGYIHEGYIQPPFSFYLEIINKFGFKDIVIVTQNDFQNPCINEMKRLLPDIRIQASDLLDDISTIMSARNLVTAHSTFSLCLGLASDKLKRMFIPQFDITNKYYYTRVAFSPIGGCFVSKTSTSHFRNLDCDVRLVKILDYVPIGAWQNSPKQRNQMLAHSRDLINFRWVNESQT
jgi:hypothetical protein